MYGLTQPKDTKSYDSINSKSKRSSMISDLLSSAIADLYVSLKNKTVRGADKIYETESDMRLD
jgi:hypothetical protein